MLRPEERPCCPPPQHPVPPMIRAGLSRIPRQTTGFPEYRRALLGAIDSYPALAGWTADSAHDLGVMLLEAWAYVLDITGFYDALIANRSYLATADDDTLAREIVVLTGYRPRPALVAFVRLAIEARGRDPVTVPPATGFRSQPFGEEPAQVFELPAEAKVWPQRNRWALLPIRQTSFDGTLRFLPSEGPAANSIIGVTSGMLIHVARVTTSETGPAEDGEKYRRLTLDTPLPASFTGQPLAGLRVAVLSLSAFPSPLDGSAAVNNTTAILDALYPMIVPGTPAAVEVNGTLRPAILSSVSIHNHAQSIGSSGATATIPLTQIGYPDIGMLPSGAAIRIHLVPKDVGRPIGLILPTTSAAAIAAHGQIAPPDLPLAEAPASGEAIALGPRARGLFLPGSIAGQRFVPDTGAASDMLETPAAVYGNTVIAVRGETVANEVVGSGNAQISSQRFKLKKKPLCWIEDASTGTGRAPQIELRVDGIAWSYAESFYDKRSDARIFGIGMAFDGTATIMCGDGVNGARFPSGVRNIVANYRYGAGAAKPPPGSITQFARAAASLQRVLQPLDVWGGADAETAAELRAVAPGAALTLGRAVSLADFEAMARAASGVANAAVAYSWDQGRQTAVVTVWIIADSGDPSPSLAAFLAARAAPGLTIRVLPATKLAVPIFDVAIEVASGYSVDLVRAQVRTTLFDSKSGLLAPRNVPVAAPLFRSALLAAIHAVPGVANVPAITLAAGPMGKALVPGEGAWFDFLTNGQVV